MTSWDAVFWTGEIIVWMGLAFVWIVPTRLAHRHSRAAVRLYAEGSRGLRDGTLTFDEYDTYYQLSTIEWAECFAWHSLNKRLFRVIVPTSIALLLIPLAGWVT